jgi:CRP/FNR family transcriptional regulator/CRP/FNR family cyclic AMP-dependent transcriptional regulator
MLQQTEGLIRDIPLLAKLTGPDLRALASRGRVRRYSRGATIFREGDRGDSLHVVVEGSVRVTVGSARGDEATVAILGPGEFVGDLALLDGLPRSANAVALDPVRTLVVTRDDFRRWLSERPRASLSLLEALSLRVRRTDEVLADLTFLPLPSRLAKRLLALASDRPDAAAKLRITQAQLASMLGVSRESVNKQLNDFEKRGWVKLGRGTITLRDEASLRRWR